MDFETKEHNEAAKFLDESQDFAHKIGELAKSEGISTTVFMFSILASMDALEQMRPVQFEAVKEFYNLLAKNKRGN